MPKPSTLSRPAGRPSVVVETLGRDLEVERSEHAPLAAVLAGRSVDPHRAGLVDLVARPPELATGTDGRLVVLEVLDAPAEAHAHLLVLAQIAAGRRAPRLGLLLLGRCGRGPGCRGGSRAGRPPDAAPARSGPVSAPAVGNASEATVVVAPARLHRARPAGAAVIRLRPAVPRVPVTGGVLGHRTALLTDDPVRPLVEVADNPPIDHHLGPAGTPIPGHVPLAVVLAAADRRAGHRRGRGKCIGGQDKAGDGGRKRGRRQANDHQNLLLLRSIRAD
jgi:hypothetical protein